MLVKIRGKEEQPYVVCMAHSMKDQCRRLLVSEMVGGRSIQFRVTGYTT